jgi:hypothetical protein
MKPYWLLIAFLLLFATPVRAQDSGGVIACSMEAKQCPDGSYVSRTGPHCEFTPCPGGGDSGAGTPAPSADENRGALEQWLSSMPAAASGQIEEFSDPAVAALFPTYHFYTLRFRMHPVARLVPEPLKASNVFAVANRVVTLIADQEQLKSFFQSNLMPLADDNAQHGALLAWLALTQELQQDAFFRFAAPDEFSIQPTPSRGRVVSGKVSVTQGGKGHIDASLTFSENGIFIDADTIVRLLPGMRPL